MADLRQLPGSSPSNSANIGLKPLGRSIEWIILTLTLAPPTRAQAGPDPAIDETLLSDLEARRAPGLTSAEILDFFARHGLQLSEATLRKYVQLGLLPRSVRVGRKGKHLGSQGVYPVSVVRQILRIKQMMAERYTIEQIQREVLFIRSDLEQLRQVLDVIFTKLDEVLQARRREGVTQSVAQEVGEARGRGRDLLAFLSVIETKLTQRARIESVAS